MKLAVQLVTWNGQEYIPELFASLEKQNFSDWELLIWDNGSSDHTLELIDQHKQQLNVPVRIVKSSENIGFSPAHDSLFGESQSEYVLTLNQDVILEKNVFLALVSYLDNHKNIGSVAPRVMRLENMEKTSLIDSLGLEMRRSRQVVDFKAGEVWDPEEYCRRVDLLVFGVSAAVAMYSRSVVRKTGDTLFDRSYFAYQEDIDLAWRLQKFGFASAVALEVVAWHSRGSRESVKKGIIAAIKNKLYHQSYLVRYHSYKNHLMTIYKNENWQNFLLDFIWIFWYELKKFLYFLILDPKILGGLGEVWKNRARLFEERRRIAAGGTRSWREIGKWLA